MGISEWSNWHPVLDTLIIGFLISIPNIPFMFSLFQSMLWVIAIIYISKTISVVTKNNYLGIASTVLFSLHPLLLYSSTEYYKDGLNMVFVLFLYAQLIKIIYSKNQIFNKIGFNIGFVIVGFFILSLRKNLFIYYILVLIIVIIIAIKNKSNKVSFLKLGIPFGATLLAFIIFSTVVNLTLHPIPSPTSEALSVPLQQVAASLKYGKVAKDDKEYFYSIVKKAIWKNYDPLTSNALKGGEPYGIENLKLKEFIPHYFNVLLKNKKVSIKAFYNQSKQWYNPKYIFPSPSSTMSFAAGTEADKHEINCLCTKEPVENLVIDLTKEEDVIKCYKEFASKTNPNLSFETYSQVIGASKNPSGIFTYNSGSRKVYNSLFQGNIRPFLNNITMNFYILFIFSIALFVFIKIGRKKYKVKIPSYYLFASLPLLLWFTNLFVTPRPKSNYSVPYVEAIPILILLVIYTVIKLYQVRKKD
jgi:hypothetical protein